MATDLRFFRQPVDAFMLEEIAVHYRRSNVMVGAAKLQGKAKNGNRELSCHCQKNIRPAIDRPFALSFPLSPFSTSRLP
jgi:hypothetical protein